MDDGLNESEVCIRVCMYSDRGWKLKELKMEGIPMNKQRCDPSDV